MKNNNVYYIAEKRKISSENKIYYKRKWFLLLIILFFFIAYFYLINNRVLLYTVHYGEVVDGFKTEGLVLRNETVFYSNESGYIQLRKSEGERIFYGEEVLKINDKLIYNRQAGLISYANDGLERLNPYTLDYISIDEFKSYQRNFSQNISGDYLREGQVAYRIISNNKLYIVIKNTTREINRYRINERVFIQAPDIRNSLIQARVKDIYLGEENSLMLISLDNFIDQWLNTRWVEVEFIKNIYRGMIIPREAIFISPEGQGVLLYRNGDYIFREINILNGNRENVIVNGLRIGDQIVVNPEELNYGRGV
ncbi:HlyD family efflux transporter periplasmic adaptor subunit [Natronospora cellulosivora (SeqCode)]